MKKANLALAAASTNRPERIPSCPGPHAYRTPGRMRERLRTIIAASQLPSFALYE
ncbi:MAG: hypothetical protein JST30_07780 [Armatimonadetes bacterium]|nr:hypothetical protein [Armatimonadota bacterium]